MQSPVTPKKNSAKRKNNNLSKISVDESQRLRTRVAKLESLLDVAKAMTAERNLDALLHIILSAAVRVVDADRCTLWIVDRKRNELWTKVAHGLADGACIRVPIGVGIAGQVAQTAKLINIPDAYADERFNREVDKNTGYLTRNLLGVPMYCTTGEVTGVLQALNKKDGPFTSEDEDLLIALGSNAAAAIENALLYEDIDRLFEGFVKASVVAIESRDPTTSGHSERVAKLTVAIAENVDRVTIGTYAALRFSREQIRELRYAALLHDFGKVGVRENVLTKADKLFDSELSIIETRFFALLAQRENQYLKSLIVSLQNGASIPENALIHLNTEMKKIKDLLDFIRQCNKPTVLAAGSFEKLNEIAAITYTDIQNQTKPLLLANELERLSIPKGSLDANERHEIESHVTHTFRFLSLIPWTRSLHDVPQIAYAHHEALDGTGYPRHLEASNIPIQSRIMSIADIYDALTASDRPYKKAVSHELALNIISSDAKKGKLDQDLFDIFVSIGLSCDNIALI
ncbi:MAG: GAF domain-containing protein [Deltaproteobacteria bacterium]|nr:GAF domain-containing protein [Deltaproteobacteria bacterium]